MAAIDFPNSPADGDIFSTAGTTWQYASATGTWTVVRNGLMTVLDSQTFTASTTYAMPSGAKQVIVECLSAGGGGADAQSGAGYSGSGGSGGGYYLDTLPVDMIGASAVVVVGAGGAANVYGDVSRFGPLYYPGGRGGFAGSTTRVGHGTPESGQAAAATNAVGIGLAGKKGFRGGGGGGSGAKSSGASQTGGAGGSTSTDASSVFTGFSDWTPAAGSGGAGGAGAAGSAGSTKGYGGGGGGATATGFNGGTGGVGAGGGGGGLGSSTSGSGGSGGRAEIRIWVMG